MKFDYDEYVDLKSTEIKYNEYKHTDNTFGVHPILWFAFAGFIALIAIVCYTVFF